MTKSLQETTLQPKRRVKPLRFYNPIGGRAKPAHLSSLFLLSPETIIKVCGYSFRGLFEEVAGEAFFKKIYRVQTRKQAPTPAMLEHFIKLLSHGSPITESMKAALSGDRVAGARFNAMGLWEAVSHGVFKGETPWSATYRFIVSIERASREPERLIRQGDFSGAASCLKSDELLSLFVWPEVLELISSAESAKALRYVQASVALEVQLAILIAADVETERPSEELKDVLPDFTRAGLNPTQLFFRYLLHASGRESMQAFLDDERMGDGSPCSSTLKRWSAGSHHPDPVWLRLVIKAIWEDADYAPAWNRYWAARHLNYIGYLAQRCVKASKLLEGTAQARDVAPWPLYPFGYASFEEWVASRYPFWREYHLRLAGQED